MAKKFLMFDQKQNKTTGFMERFLGGKSTLLYNQRGYKLVYF